MAERGNENPAVNPSQDGSQEVGERIGSLETQLSELATLVSSQQDLLKSLVEMQQGKEKWSSLVLSVLHLETPDWCAPIGCHRRSRGKYER